MCNQIARMKTACTVFSFSSLQTSLIALTLSISSVSNVWANEDQAHVVTDDIEFSCAQTADNTAIRCAYRLVEPDLTNRISASLGDTELPIKDISTYPFENSTTSMLFLLDTSLIPEQDVLSSIQNDVTAYAQQALPHQSIGLASFDSTLSILQPVGSDPIEVINSISTITSTEQPTELYRNTLDAINLLVSSQADRKALFLFSAGESNDQAVYHSDVVKAAVEANVKINTIAYPASGDSALKHLKDLANETAGLYVEASRDGFELPESVLLDPFASIENGGVLTIDLSPALASNLQGLQIAALVFETTSKRITVKLPLELSSSPDNAQASFKKADLESSQVLAPTQTATENANEATQALTGARSVLEQYWLIIPAALVFFAAAGLAYITFRPRQSSTRKDTDEKDDQPLGYFIPLSDETTQHPILNTPFKIGRSRQNDMFLEHSSVSREHAEFKRNRDGSYTITDLDSLNGVYLNNSKVSTGLVMDGDQIDIGDVRLKFVTTLD